MLRKLKNFPIFYNKLCDKSPFLTISLSTGIILGVGDIMT